MLRKCQQAQNQGLCPVLLSRFHKRTSDGSNLTHIWNLRWKRSGRCFSFWSSADQVGTPGGGWNVCWKCIPGVPCAQCSVEMDLKFPESAEDDRIGHGVVLPLRGCVSMTPDNRRQRVKSSNRPQVCHLASAAWGLLSCSYNMG